VVGTRADDTALTGHATTTEGVGSAADNQDAERVVLAWPATVPSQDPASGGTTGSRVTVTVRDRP